MITRSKEGGQTPKAAQPGQNSHSIWFPGLLFLPLSRQAPSYCPSLGRRPSLLRSPQLCPSTRESVDVWAIPGLLQTLLLHTLLATSCGAGQLPQVRPVSRGAGPLITPISDITEVL